MIRKPLFCLSLLFLLGIVSVLGTPIKVEGSAPELLEVRLNAARGPAPSRYHKVRHEHFVDGPGRVASNPDAFYDTLPILHRDGWALPTDDNRLTLEDSPRAAYYRAGDAFEVTLKFNEPVQVDTSNPPTLYTDADGFVGDCKYVGGTGTDELTFRDIVQEGEHTFGGLGFVSQALWQNVLQPTSPGGRVKGTMPLSNPKRITDLEGNEFNQRADIQIQFWAFLTGMPEILTDPTITSQDPAVRLKIGTPPGVRYDDAYFRGLIKHLVDTIPATVWIPGLIKNGDTHTDDRRIKPVSVVTYTHTSPTYEPDDFTVDINETTTQKDAFDVEFRFFNYEDDTNYPGPDVFADEVGTSFESEDVQISGPGVTRGDWDVTLTYVGLDLRAANQWPGDWPGRTAGASHGPGEVKRSPSFLVYKATITPPNGFDGEVEISLEQGATMDIAGNPSKASNRLTVPVRTPPTVQVARPEGETGLVLEAFKVEFSFSRNVLSPFDAEKISITQADGTALAWDVAVTQPASPSATVSAVITPALNFSGEVHITLGAGAVQDAVAGSEQVNVAAVAPLVVTVDTLPPQVIETPAIVEPPPGGYTVGAEFTVEIPFDEAGVTYEGDNPPYVVLYLGARVLANARHATWQRGSERAGSTIVPFVYPIRAGDTATSLSIDESGILIPAGTRVVDGDGNQLLGEAPPPVKPTEPVTQLPEETDTDERIPFPPTTEEAALTFNISETPVFTHVPLLETTEPKSAATDVPRSPIVFNELGNGSGDTDDWLEFRNVTGSAVSLKEWELSVVQDAKKEDTSLIVFPDVSVPANGLLLLTNSDADKTPLAAGDNIADTGKNGGSKHLYLVNAGLSLPDDGKFLLILRKAKEKLGKDEAFVDVAGGGGSDTDAFIREQTGLYDTHVWPLQVLEAPGSDTEEALGSGKVWQRAKADIVGYHKDAWAEAAFTGLGYDRKVLKSAATAGTPGYPNVAPKEAAAKGNVTFSEIMVDSAGGTLPQWIELYNKSKTDAVNLNRWKLEIQNVDSEDLIGRPIVTLTLQEKVIQPNQTLLIVAGPARASSGAYLPADRVYDLLALHDKNLRIKRARDTFLSAEGIYLKLWDSTGTLVDEVGNTDGNRRTKDEPAWPLAMSAEEGVRSSLIRRYTDGTSEAKDGTEKGTWVLAANVKKVVDGELHWGSAEDIGTPGYRRGGALPVELSSFSVMRNEAGAVVLTWTTESEVDNAGFNLRRSKTRNSGFTLINPALIAGAGTTGERQTYTFTDTSAKPGVEYYYQIEEVAFDGKPETLAKRMLRGPVSASNRALLTFGELKRRD